MIDSIFSGFADSPNSKRQLLILLSPILVILLGQLAARTLVPIIGIWSWVPLNLGYWSFVILLIAWGGGREAVIKWLQPSQGKWLWSLLAICIAVLPTLPMQFPDTWHLLLKVKIWLPTLFFVLINPCAEECYWRGLLLDNTIIKTRRLAVIYSSILSMINHMWISITAIGARNPMASVFQFVFAVIMSITYLKTQSLRWPLVAHFLANLLTPTVAVFLNLYIPTSP
jgi:membrane protease YdiL (CAAX protease family)